ncbi:MAG TPA: hypothetical protein VF016_05690 [Nitrososphaera sp.]|jgi:hypothetical protein|nr:hypothetical protein [uncultured Nitrososphaera sp.]
MMASRAGIIGIFAAVGFAIGFMAYLATPAVGQYLKAIWPMLDQSIIMAMVCGGAGAAISTITVTAWAKKA